MSTTTTTTTTSSTTTTTTTTTQPPYAVDSDLLTRRPNILSLGVIEWASFHEKAKTLINRDLEAMWYRDAAILEGLDPRENSFAPSKILNSEDQITDLGIFKALELIYEYLSKDSDSDNYQTFQDRYRSAYRAELKSVINLGIHYDWDSDGIIDVDEKYSQTQPRRLLRT